ncbi:MAG: four-carbon acid sugar kinase family protein [Balneolales bacterium]
MKVIIIADDLTGALDSSVAFAQRGLRTICALTIDKLPEALSSGADVVAVSTGSREVSRHIAVERAQRVKGMLVKAPPDQQCIWFKKIDSRLKGHIRAEVSVLRQNDQEVFVMPAIPKLGRFVNDGVLYGAGVQVPINVSERVGLADAMVVDSRTDADLDIAIEKLPRDALVVGAAGVGAALARLIKPDAGLQSLPDLNLPALLVIGSTDPITLAQLTSFRVTCAPNGQVPVHGVRSVDGVNIVQMVPGDESISGEMASKRFSEGVSRWIDDIKPRILFATGGETSAAVLEQLGCGLLEVKGEVLPGLPCSTALDGRPGLKVVTKSGGFGPTETLVNFIDILVKK